MPFRFLADVDESFVRKDFWTIKPHKLQVADVPFWTLHYSNVTELLSIRSSQASHQSLKVEAMANMLIPIKDNTQMAHNISKRVEVNTGAKIATSFRQAEVNQILKALAVAAVATPIHSAQAMSVRIITVVNLNKVPALVRLRKHHIQVNITDLVNKVDPVLHLHMVTVSFFSKACIECFW